MEQTAGIFNDRGSSYDKSDISGKSRHDRSVGQRGKYGLDGEDRRRSEDHTDQYSGNT